MRPQILVLIFILNFASVAMCTKPEVGYISVYPSASIRESPSLESSIVAQPLYGEAVKIIASSQTKQLSILGRTGYWTEVSYDGKGGFIFSELLSPNAEPDKQILAGPLLISLGELYPRQNTPVPDQFRSFDCTPPSFTKFPKDFAGARIVINDTELNLVPDGMFFHMLSSHGGIVGSWKKREERIIGIGKFIGDSIEESCAYGSRYSECIIPGDHHAEIQCCIKMTKQENQRIYGKEDPAYIAVYILEMHQGELYVATVFSDPEPVAGKKIFAMGSIPFSKTCLLNTTNP